MFNYGDSTPAVDDQDRPWIRTIGGKPDRMYSFISGQWISKHSIPAGGNVRQMWVGSEGDLETYDGGAAGAVNEMAGPFWTVDTAMAARFPVGVGDFAAAVKATGGEENHTLLTAEMPAHKHAPFSGGKKIWHDKYNGSGQDGTTGDTRVNHFGDGPEGAGISLAEDLYKEAGDGEAHNNLPPYYGVYFIKRTSRIYYTV